MTRIFANSAQWSSILLTCMTNPVPTPHMDIKFHRFRPQGQRTIFFDFLNQSQRTKYFYRCGEQPTRNAMYGFMTHFCQADCFCTWMGQWRNKATGLWQNCSGAFRVSSSLQDTCSSLQQSETKNPQRSPGWAPLTQKWAQWVSSKPKLGCTFLIPCSSALFEP
jgi:hypothetical protein